MERATGEGPRFLVHITNRTSSGPERQEPYSHETKVTIVWMCKNFATSPLDLVKIIVCDYHDIYLQLFIVRLYMV